MIEIHDRPHVGLGGIGGGKLVQPRVLFDQVRVARAQILILAR
jgi:hypothetical protein